MALPVSAALQSNSNKLYLGYNREGEGRGHLQFNEREILNEPITTQFAFEVSKSNSELFHVRCCYNNRYWVRNSSTEYWIIASAEEPEEDTSLWSCTLYKPVFTDNTNRQVHLSHIQTDFFLHYWPSIPPLPAYYDHSLYAVALPTPTPHLNNAINLIDWETLVLFPNRVAFIGDNNKFLTVRDNTNGTRVLAFSSDDVGESAARNEVTMLADGTIRIKNLDYEDSYWTVDDNGQVLPNGSDSRKQIFMPIKVADGSVALRSVSSSSFCSRDPSDDQLICRSNSVVRQAMFEVREPVIIKRVYNVIFRLQDARIHNLRPLVMASGVAVNRTQETHTRTMLLSYEDSTSKAWRTSHSLTVGVKFSFTTGVPFLVQKGIEITAEYAGDYEWGETITETRKLEDSYSFPVPPMTQTTVRLLATQGTCDVPFSYTVNDLYTDGTTRIYTLSDGVYNGVNCFNFNYESYDSKLPETMMLS